ncbi:hypothetical protein TNCV_2139391 [Trichonephila clavipes]|uniref:Uncharacterized protein n=1 Tax=Trichonephila clavipes TaxID=2585209 RepID=A0A8X6RRP4_TRICX|nr:hypothetical protein TNCV_2139391 [Trichonephila clavipes]
MLPQYPGGYGHRARNLVPLYTNREEGLMHFKCVVAQNPPDSVEWKCKEWSASSETVLMWRNARKVYIQGVPFTYCHPPSQPGTAVTEEKNISHVCEQLFGTQSINCVDSLPPVLMLFTKEEKEHRGMCVCAYLPSNVFTEQLTLTGRFNEEDGPGRIYRRAALMIFGLRNCRVVESIL